MTWQRYCSTKNVYVVVKFCSNSRYNRALSENVQYLLKSLKWSLILYTVPTDICYRNNLPHKNSVLITSEVDAFLSKVGLLLYRVSYLTILTIGISETIRDTKSFN